ncbi:MAG: DUF348 domain-containing protein [Anaerolineae bacterium]|nr:DUF348 domain-containing protein [Anaerolineae bacterium]
MSEQSAGREQMALSVSFQRGLTALATLVLLGGLAAGYQVTAVPVTLVVDGGVHPLYTHQETVGALLLDAGLELYAEDRVIPDDLEAEVVPGMVVTVARARPVLLRSDGQTQCVRTHALTVDQILQEAGILLGPHDRVELENRPVNGDNLLHVDVQRAVPVTLHEDGQAMVFYTVANTIGGALREVGLALYLADRVEPELREPISAGMHVYVERSQPVTVQVDGRTIRTRTHRDRVAHVLADLGIVLTGQDYVTPVPETPLTPDMAIRVTRVTERFVVQQEPIPFDVVWSPDPELEIDHQRLLQEGAPGVLERRFRLRYEDGQEVSRTLEITHIAVPPTTKVYGYGTMIVVRQLDTPQGPVEYWRTVNMLATSYSASTAGTPRTSPYYGRTRMGLPMRHGIVAVDPNLIPLGSQVYVPNYGVGLAADTGGAIRGRRIDLGYDDDNLVLWYRWVDVYLLTPVPPASQIDYIIGQ